MGIVALAFLAAKIARAGGDDDVNFETDQFGCKVRQPFAFPFCISVLNDNVFSFDIAKLAQPLAKCFDPGRIEGRGGRDQNSYPGNSRRLLRLGGEAKRKEHGAKRDANEFLLHNLSQLTRYHRILHGMKNKGPTGEKPVGPKKIRVKVTARAESAGRIQMFASVRPAYRCLPIGSLGGRDKITSLGYHSTLQTFGL